MATRNTRQSVETGTEDYFCGSYNFENQKTHQYQEFTTPYAGIAPSDPSGWPISGCYGVRLVIAGSILVPGFVLKRDLKVYNSRFGLAARR